MAFPGRNGRIAFASPRVTPINPEGGLEVYTMNPDGSGLTQLTANVALDDAPSWSPDGTKIAFSRTRDGNLEVYTRNGDGSGQANRIADAATDLSPDWQPKRRR